MLKNINIIVVENSCLLIYMWVKNCVQDLLNRKFYIQIIIFFKFLLTPNFWTMAYANLVMMCSECEDLSVIFSAVSFWLNAITECIGVK